MWRLILACTPEPDTGECPEACDVSLEIVPPSGLTGVLTVRSDPPGYAFGGALLDPDGAEIRSVNGLSEAEIELLPGDLVAGETYTLTMGYACEPGAGQPTCGELQFQFVATDAGTGGTTTTTTTTTGNGVTDVIVQVPPPETDVLFVVDNSGSMADEQQSLVESFPIFLNYFLGSGLDYHIGVTSTDIDQNYNGSKGKLVVVGGERWIDDGTPDPIATFDAMASLGTGGSGNEKGRGAAFQALETNRDTSNQGFLRDESGVHVIVISDEPDATSAGLIDQNEFVEWFDGLRDDVADRTFSSFVDPQYGRQYVDLTRQIGGVVADILNDDFAVVLEELGVVASGLAREFPLSREPDPDTIEVTVETPLGVVLAFDRDEDWVYEAERNSVRFLEYVPEAESEVVIHYDPVD